MDNPLSIWYNEIKTTTTIIATKGKASNERMMTETNQTRNPKNWFVGDAGKMVTLSVTIALI